MTAEKRRALRMLCKALLLISLPLVGFVWALPENSMMMLGAGALTLLCLVVGFGAEYLASSTENDLQELEERAEMERHRRAAALEERDEKVRQFDRMVSVLTGQNHDLRAKLVSVQVELQRRREDLLQAAGKAVGLDGMDATVETMNPAFSARAH